MNLDPSHLFKLRLAVARFGEMDGAGWWNSKGILGNPGKSVLARGFPKTHLFTQARIACAVATARCNSIFAPPGCLTLWNLPAEVDAGIEESWSDWCRNPAPWEPFFEQLAEETDTPLLGRLLALRLIDSTIKTAVTPLKRSAEGKSVPLPGTGKPDLPTLMLLAAAFSKGERLKPAVPYIRRDL